jgi:proteic killer suppression protein
MIVSFGDQATDDLYNDRKTSRVRRLPTDALKRARKRLMVLDVAGTLDVLAKDPGLYLEKLSGDLRGFWSIRVTKQWRFIFRWTSAGPADVSLVDYHRNP